MLAALACQAAETAPPSEASPPPVNRANYVLHVDWTSQRGGTNSLQILTSEGNFRLDGSQPNTVKVGDSEIAVSMNLSGDLRPLDSQHARVQFFLGRNVPYVTHSGGAPGSTSIQQRQEGLNSTFLVAFGKRILIQKDGNGEVSVLVERVEP